MSARRSAGGRSAVCVPVGRGEARGEAVARGVTSRPCSGAERGAGTVLTLGLVLVLLVALAAVAVLGRTVQARGVARTAADLGALTAAAALHSPVPGGDPCAAAARVAQAQGAHVLACAVEGDTVLVTAAADVDLGAFGARVARASARAGPAS